jgi:hypothetical protein
MTTKCQVKTSDAEVLYDVCREIDILREAGLFPPTPPEIARGLDIEYTDAGEA